MSEQNNKSKKIQIKSKKRKVSNNQKGCKKYIFIALSIFIGLVLFLVLLAIVAPSVFVVVINIIWTLVFGIVVIFIFLAVLVIFGLKKEAERLINILLEGSMTLIDLANFAKRVFVMFKRYLRELTLIITPILAYFTGALVYVGLMYMYKSVGKSHDITVFTVILTIILTFVAGFMNKPKKEEKKRLTWFQKAKERYIKHFKDSLEIIIFVFFLTMDMTNLFFLPDKLNVELHAVWEKYDLMVRSFTFDEYLKTTIKLVTVAISLETVRNIIKIIILAIRNYKIAIEYLEERSKEFQTVEVVKLVLRQSVKDSMDDVLKFITFTTVLIGVFVLFPRLKLLSLVVANISSLILDFIIIDRLKIQGKGDDLISRIIVKVFRL